MLRKIRIAIAMVILLSATLLFVDISGTAHTYLSWVAKMQFLPALLATNLVVVLTLLIATLIFGRVYCSVICPLGILQDVIAYFGKRAKKNRYSASPALTALRWGMVCLAALAFALGAGSIVALVAPYSSFGRIAQNIFQPIWAWGNNVLAMIAEHYESYAFYTVDVWVRSGATLAIAIVTLVAIGILAWRNGRTYCNTICPVGTLLGAVSRFSILAPTIDKSKCIGCKLCEKNCKAACISIGDKQSASRDLNIDHSRCVTCMDCIDKCPKGAIGYGIRSRKSDTQSQPTTTATNNDVDTSRRAFLSVAGITVAGAAMAQKEKLVDGGLTILEDKVAPKRETPIVPPGAQSIRNFTRHCTGCQLCVAQCPNHVLRPQTSLMNLMQPEMSFERGYCRPECTRCSEVCPAGAIKPIDAADKSATHIGHAVWVRDLCVPLTDGVSCGNCASHCPTGAITMVPSDKEDKDSPRIPAIDVETCIGCGACEHLCPARPLSAIYVEGHENHRIS